jgi:hypothetical protein
MRLFADENFPLPTVEALRKAGHDVTWAGTELSRREGLSSPGPRRGGR